MRICVIPLRRLRRGLLCLLCLIAAFFLLRFPQAAQNGISRGLAVCTDQLIPSLFPFLVLTGFIIKSGVGDDITAALTRTVPCLRSRGQACSILLFSMLGGYPTGGYAITAALQQGTIDSVAARPLLRCAVHAAPAFVIGGVGIGMLGSVQAGLWLWIAHLLSSVLLWPLWRPLTPAKAPCRRPLPLARAVTDSIREACVTLVGMAGCILTACTALALIDALGAAAITSPILRALIAVPLEVTTGCLESVACGAQAPFFLGLALGCGGLSVCGQIASLTAPYNLVDRDFFTARLLHGLLGGCLSLLLFRWFPPPVAATAVSVNWCASVPSGQNGIAAAVLLMLMAVIFLASIPEQGILRMRPPRFS